MADTTKASARTTLALAEIAIRAARKRAQEIGVAQNVAIVDEGTNLVAFERMDGGWIGSIEIAIDKAYTARAFDMTTKELGKLSQPEEPAFGIARTNHGRVIIFAGGIPLRVDGQIVGGIGVSGGTPQQDEDVAQAGAKAFEEAAAVEAKGRKAA